MASVRKILEKHQGAKKTIVVESQQQQPAQEQPEELQHPQALRQPQFVTSASTYSPIQQKQLEPLAVESAELAAAHNPYTFECSCRYFPGSAEVMDLCKFPLGFFMSPYPDANTVQTEIQSDRIPRCANCRAYFNLHCKIAPDGSIYNCSLCTCRNAILPDFKARPSGPERTSASYTVYPPESQFPQPPCVNCFVFLLDVSNSAAASQMLFYAVSAIKEVLADERFDDYYVLLYTYDESLHYYNLEGCQPTRTVVDRNIEQLGLAKNLPELSQVRSQLFEVLDSLEDFAKHNPAARSRFFGSFTTVFEATRLHSPKIFVTQANQMFVAEEWALEKPAPPSNDPNGLRKSVFETTNKTFFNQYVGRMLESNVSVSFFCFSKNHKNLRVLSDLAKLTNSELQLYLKDNKEDLMKFYYEMYALLGASYLGEFRMEINLTPGWVAQGVYGNMYRSKDNSSSCRAAHLDDRKRVAVNLSMLTNYLMLPQLCVQTVATYSEQRIRKTTITTYVLPITNSAYHIYDSINWSVTAGLFHRIYLSSLRMENNMVVRNKYVRAVSALYVALKGFRKGAANFSPQETMFFQGTLSFLKNQHSHPDNYLNSMVMDRLVCQRNFLQCTSSEELVTYFTPYLFRLSDMPPDCCTVGQNGLVYPENCELSFQSIGSGIFLMDCTVHMFLFIARQYNSAELRELFGVEKYGKDTVLTEEILAGRLTVLSQKVMALVQAIRERKHYAYAPLYVIKCGEASPNELRFYLNFAGEKYEEFRSVNMNFKEFVAMLESQVGF